MDALIPQLESLLPGGPAADHLIRIVRDLPPPRGKAAALHKLISAFDPITPSVLDLDSATVRIGHADDITVDQRKQLLQILLGLRPWRKGPFSLFGIDVDCEWRSDLKWRRLEDHIAPLRERVVLDIGSSSGYYMFRMAALGPAMVLGLEPYPVYFYQYRFLRQFLADRPLFCLPVKDEALSGMGPTFDTIFAMGVLYHCRHPRKLLHRLRQLLRPGGELVLETLIIAGDGDDCLIPRPRYAKMSNVHHLPTVPRLTRWISAAGFDPIRCCDVTPTTAAEQRRTPWMPYESLSDFLDPADPGQTVERHPAPVRALLLAGAGE